MPRDACGPGFHPDDAASTCEVVLPIDACPKGQLAVPGDEACRPVAECGDDPYGDLPQGASITHVDGRYGGGASDGTRERPYRTVAQGLAAASAGGVVAVAAGTYVEDVTVPPGVRLYGRCPSMVEIRGIPTRPESWPIILKNGSELHRVAVTSATPAIAVFGASDALIEEVWVHDVGDAAVVAQATATVRRASVTVRRSLIERATKFGVVGTASTVKVEDSVVRGVALAAGAKGGEGLVAQEDPDTGEQSTFEVRGSVIEGSASFGVLAIGSVVSVDACVLRANRAEREGGVGGGAFAQAAIETGRASTMTITRSLLTGNEVQGAGTKRSKLVIERSVIRDTRARPSDGIGGPGVQATVEADATIRDSVLERNHHAGALLVGGRLELDGVIVRDTLPVVADDRLGIGVGAQFEPTETSPTRLTIRRSLVIRSFFVGVLANGAELSLVDSRVEATRASASTDEFGDGVALSSVENGGVRFPARGTLERVTIVGNARAGVSAFTADLSMAASSLRCNAFDLDVEPRLLTRTGTIDGSIGAITDHGDVTCGCDTASPCKAQSAGLEPVPIEP